MRIKFLSLYVTILFLIIFFVFYSGLENSNIYKPNIKIKKEIPSFETKIFDIEKKINSKALFKNDQFYLLNIWASWCVPCKKEHMFLKILANQDKLTLIGLNYKDQNENAKIFLKELGNPYDTILEDNDGTISIEWGAYGVPESFLIYENKIIKKIIGPLDKNTLAEIIKVIG